MWWIAFAPEPAPAGVPAPEALLPACWWALRFTPRVCVADGLLLLEAEASLRLFGGEAALLERLRGEAGQWQLTAMACAPTGQAALALLRARQDTRQGAMPRDDAAAAALPLLHCPPQLLIPTLDRLPLHSLAATREHAPTLHRLGCRTLGALRRLPRASIARRFGATVLLGLDQAYGQTTETHAWVQVPEQFNLRLELPGRIDHAAGLLFGARRLLQALQAWLQMRQQGVTELLLRWEHDRWRRGDDAEGQLRLRTAEATRDMVHLGRLLGEHLARTTLQAPALALRLEATETAALPTRSANLLPDPTERNGERWPQLLERLAARLGAEHLLQGEPMADHRPGHMQVWQPATAQAAPPASAPRTRPPDETHATWQPGWLVDPPQALPTRSGQPCHTGAALTLLAGPQRLEGHWWDAPPQAQPTQPVVRDHFVAQNPQGGLLWIYREQGASGSPTWFLQGIYG